MRATKLVAFVVVAAALSAACNGKGNPGAPGGGGPLNPNELPLGTELPASQQPFPQDRDFPVQRLMETVESGNPNAPTPITAKLKRAVQISCGPPAPANIVCVKAYVAAGMDVSSYTSRSAMINVFASPDCKTKGASLGFLEFLYMGSSDVDVPPFNGTKILDYMPCGIIVEARYSVDIVPDRESRRVLADTVLAPK